MADGGGSTDGATARSDSPAPSAPSTSQEETEKPPDPELEKRLLGYLSDLSLSMPTDSLTITNELNSVSLCFRVQEFKWLCIILTIYCIFFLDCFLQSESAVTHGCIQSLLHKFSAQELIEVRQSTSASSSTTSSFTSATVVIAVDHTKLWAMIGSGAGTQRAAVKRKAEDQAHNKRATGFTPSLQSSASPPHSSTTSSLTPASSSQLAGPSALGSGAEKKGRSSKSQSSHLDMEIESLLNQQSTKEQQSKKVKFMVMTTSLTRSCRGRKQNCGGVDLLSWHHVNVMCV